MRRPHGYATFSGGFGEGEDAVLNAGRIIEYDTITCCHCNRIELIQPGSGTKRGWCFMCARPECGRPECSSATQGCVPFERKLERYERRMQLRERMGA